MRKIYFTLFLLATLLTVLAGSTSAVPTAEVTQTPSAYNAPKANANGFISPGWIASNLDYASNYTSLNAAQAALSGSTKTLIVNTVIAATSNLTTTMGLMVMQGGQINTGGFAVYATGPWNPVSPGTTRECQMPLFVCGWVSQSLITQ